MIYAAQGHQHGLAPARCCDRLCSSGLRGFSRTRFPSANANSAPLLLQRAVVFFTMCLSIVSRSVSFYLHWGSAPSVLYLVKCSQLPFFAQEAVTANLLVICLLFFEGSILSRGFRPSNPCTKVLFARKKLQLDLLKRHESVPAVLAEPHSDPLLPQMTENGHYYETANK